MSVEADITRPADIGMEALGVGRFVRADDIVAVLPIEEGRGRGRRRHVHIVGRAPPILASRMEGAILAERTAPSRSLPTGTRSDDHPSPRTP